MSVRLTPEEIDEFLTGGHTLLLGTIRKSGEPFITPLWYVYMDGAFYFRTLERSAKVGHIRRDPRVCCTVETGDAWIDLKTVIANCDAEFITGEDEIARYTEASSAKYKGFRRQPSGLPQATERHYSQPWVYIRCTPRQGEIRSWYNRKLMPADEA